MILNYPSKSEKYHQTNMRKSMKHNEYPKQDTVYVDKLIGLRYRNEKDEDTINRLKYHENIHNYRYNMEAIFLCLRCDIEYPYKAILINARGDVIVTTSAEVTQLLSPSIFTGIQHRHQVDSTIFRREYSPLIYSSDEYNDYDIANDFVHLIPAQDKEFLGLEGFTEYENDLVNKVDIPTREDQAIEQEDPNYHSIERRFEDVSRVYPKLGDVGKKNPESITSFPMMHYIHDKNYIDKPFATHNSAVIIRTDRNRDNVVFMERIRNSEDNGITLRFVTGDEAYFYYESTDQYIVEDGKDMYKIEPDMSIILNEIINGNIQK